ncbi:MAG: D-alanyl-D-alanine carboxypeptidase/D-alanyl-D-alanine-endopeptidase [Gemmatimonadota bacterium]
MWPTTERRLGSTSLPICRAMVVALGIAAGATMMPVTGHAQAIRRQLDSILDVPPFNRQLWGVALVDEQGKLLYGRNEDRLFIPASNTKLLATTVASALFSPDWTVKTSLYANGQQVNGVLEGDLVLYGRGDPTFSNRCYDLDTMKTGACDRDIFARFRTMALALKARGISSVSGDLVGDGSYFDPQMVHPGWENYDLSWWYAAPVSGLFLNDNSVDFTWGPGPAAGTPAVFSISPQLGDFTFENRTKTESGGSDNLDVYRDLASMRIRAEGDVALTSHGGTESVSMPDPNLFAARALRVALAEAGIAVLGTTRSTVDSNDYRVIRSQPALAEVESRPLRDWIFPILNTSQNTFAEYLVKQLGRIFGKGGSWDEGISVERRFLIDSVKIDSTQFNVQDGSGLASNNLVSPLAFTQMIRFIRHHPNWATFAAGFPHSGQPGSLRTRFIRTPLEGRVWAKTGSISRVNTLSGFFETTSGRRYYFSVQANHHTLPTRLILGQIDSVVVAMGKLVDRRH